MLWAIGMNYISFQRLKRKTAKKIYQLKLCVIRDPLFCHQNKINL